MKDILLTEKEMVFLVLLYFQPVLTITNPAIKTQEEGVNYAQN